MERFEKAMHREWHNLRYVYKVLSDYIPIADVPATAQKIHMLWNMEYKPDREGDKRFRARCLAKGDEETSNHDDLNTYAPTATKESLRLLLALAKQRDWENYSFDVDNAFLVTDMSDVAEAKETYFYPPPGPYERPGYMIKKLKNWLGYCTQILVVRC